jgi:aryl-alcohol dehydrogenase-like predicted oxidoreductase
MRLSTDYIDLYWVHAWDPLTPIEEIMRALDDMVRATILIFNAQIRILHYGFAGMYNKELLGRDRLDLLIVVN